MASRVASPVRHRPPNSSLGRSRSAGLRGGSLRYRYRDLARPLSSAALFGGRASEFQRLVGVGLGVIALPFFLQLDFGMSPLHAGLIMTVWPIANALVAPISGRWADRYAIGWIATGGLVVFLVSAAALRIRRDAPDRRAVGRGGVSSRVRAGDFPNAEQPRDHGRRSAGEIRQYRGDLRLAARGRANVRRIASCDRLRVVRARRRRTHAAVALHTAVLAALALACAFCVLATSSARSARSATAFTTIRPRCRRATLRCAARARSAGDICAVRTRSRPRCA